MRVPSPASSISSLLSSVGEETYFFEPCSSHPPPLEVSVTILRDGKPDTRVAVTEQVRAATVQTQTAQLREIFIEDTSRSERCQRLTLCGMIATGIGLGMAVGAGIGAVAVGSSAAVIGGAIGTVVGAGSTLGVGKCRPQTLDSVATATVKTGMAFGCYGEEDFQPEQSTPRESPLCTVDIEEDGAEDGRGNNANKC